MLGSGNELPCRFVSNDLTVGSVIGDDSAMRG